MNQMTRLVLTFMVAAYIGSTAYLYGQLSNTNRALSQNINSQVPNRAANVKAWCGGINEGRDYDRVFVRQVTRGQVRYRLGDLPCKAIVAKTLKSAQHH